MMQGFLNIPMYGWAVVALVIATIFAVVVPSADKVMALEGLPYVIARWFHSLVWVLLAASFFLKGTGNESVKGLSDLLAMGGDMLCDLPHHHGADDGLNDAGVAQKYG